MELTKENKELWNETSKVLNEAVNELRHFEDMALEKFRELADIKNRVEKLCSRISDISLKIIELNNDKELKNKYEKT